MIIGNPFADSDLSTLFQTISNKHFNNKGIKQCLENKKAIILQNLLALESDQSIAKAARELRVNDNTLYSWIDDYSHSNKINPSSMKGKNEYSFEEVNRLKKELAVVKQERDLLKKAAAYFAKESR